MYQGHEAVARLLLERGADIEMKGKGGQTLLELAAYNYHEAKKGADIEAKDKYGYTPL